MKKSIIIFKFRSLESIKNGLIFVAAQSLKKLVFIYARQKSNQMIKVYHGNSS